MSENKEELTPVSAKDPLGEVNERTSLVGSNRMEILLFSLGYKSSFMALT